MNTHTSTLTSGILYSCAKAVENVLINKVDPNTHAATYLREEHPDKYAEPEFTGKYLDLCSKLYAAKHDKTALEHANLVAASIIENQREDGYLGCLKDGLEYKNFSVWNQAFTILGLVSYHNAVKSKEALAAASKCAEFVMEYFIAGNADILDAPNAGTQHISMLAPLCDLYLATKNPRHKDYILFIVDRLKNSDLNYFDFDTILELRSKKGIETFVILMGILRYSAIFGDEIAVGSVKKYWQEVADTQIRNTGNGTVCEKFTEGGNGCMLLGEDMHPNETCVAVGWIELSLSLFFLERDAKYLDAVDKTLYNHILGAISPDGSDFSYYQPNFGKKIRSINGEYKCCRYRGFTLFTYMNDMLVFESENEIIPIIYASCTYSSDDTEMTVKTGYPFDSAVAVSVKCKADKTLKLRVPKNCTAVSLTVNGREVSKVTENGYILVSVSAGEYCESVLTLRHEFLYEYGSIDGEEYVSINYGPTLLASTDAAEAEKIIKNKLSPIAISPQGNEKIAFSVIGKNGNIRLCDYASAENFNVWIKAD